MMDDETTEPTEPTEPTKPKRPILLATAFGRELDAMESEFQEACEFGVEMGEGDSLLSYASLQAAIEIDRLFRERAEEAMEQDRRNLRSMYSQSHLVLERLDRCRGRYEFLEELAHAARASERWTAIRDEVLDFEITDPKLLPESAEALRMWQRVRRKRNM